MSLLTTPRNRLVDGEALVALAPDGKLRESLEAELREVASSPPHEADGIFKSVADGIMREYQSIQLEWTAWQQVVRVASTLVENSILWARVMGFPWERHIVKCSFEQPEERESVFSRRLLTAFSWSASRASYSLPNFGERGSYHLEVTPPPGLEVANVELELSEQPPRRWRRPERPNLPVEDRIKQATGNALARLQQAVRARYDAMFGTVHAGETRNVPAHTYQPLIGDKWKRVEPDRAYFYISGHHDHYGVVTVYRAPERVGLVSNALIASVSIALLLTVFFIGAGSAVTNESASVTTLLLVPGLLGFFALGIGEHPTSRVHVAGVRGLLLAAGGLSVAAAVALVTASHSAKWWWLAFAIMAWVIVGLLTLSWLLPVQDEPGESMLGRRTS